MKILAINCRRNDTQLILGKKIDEGIEVLRIEEEKSITASIANGYTQKSALVKFFKKISTIDKKIQNYHIGIPPNMTRLNYAKSDLVSNISEHLKKWLSQILDVNENDYYLDTPMLIRDKQGNYNITAGATKKHIVDSMFAAAVEASMRLTSIEPSAIAAIRYIASNSKSKPFCLLETEKNQMTATGFYPQKGAFTMHFPEMGWVDFLNENDRVIAIEKYLQIFDHTAFETFNDTEIFDMYVLPEKHEEIKKAFESSEAKERLKNIPKSNEDIFNDIVIDKSNYAAALGLLIKSIQGD